jgi:hypothetical protein
MKLRVEAMPRLRHGQKINRMQANRFFQQSLAWLRATNQRIANLKNASPSRNFVAERAEKFRVGLEQIVMHVDWLKERGFRDHQLESILVKTEKRIDDLIEERNSIF